MQRIPSPENRTQKNIDRACDYVSDLWFPPNHELLTKVRTGIREGFYDLDFEALIGDLKNDFSLFMYCFKELVKMLQREGAAVPAFVNPLDALRTAGLEKLRAILEVEDGQISRHSISDMAEGQTSRMHEALISASASQVLAISHNLEPEIGFSCALVRQLGYTLISWNYPSVYEEALHAQTADVTLDQLIAEKLGFSPTLLAIRILRRWGLPVEFCEALFVYEEDPADQENEEVFHIMNGSLAKLCSVGEALARANDPQHYPNAKHDWEMSERVIKERLGTAGMELIRDALRENMESYLQYMPEIFQAGLLLDPATHIASINDDLPQRNPYLVLCDESVQNRLMQLYNSLKSKTIMHTALHELIKSVIPMAGFTGGAVYTADPGVMLLIPQATVLNPRGRKISTVDYSVVGSAADTVAVAFRGIEPIVEYKMSTDRQLMSCISGSFGKSTRIGVLYLEMDHATFAADEKRATDHFKALRIALNDCLSLA